MVSRPELTAHISLTDFREFYWLKEELVDFCRLQGLPATGSKAEISAGIEHFLETGNISAVAKSRRTTACMPDSLSRDTVIGTDWHCSEPLRAFFVREIGPQFHFNGTMRDIIQNGAGKTLQDAIDVWYDSSSTTSIKKEIAPQFEYNQHMRDFFAENPEKTRQEAIEAWNAKKARRRNR
jgi:hypothetical protein